MTISPSLSLYRMVVFPAASRPTMRILISFLPIRLFSRLPKMFPMTTGGSHLDCNKTGRRGKKCTRDKPQTTDKLDTAALRLATLNISTSLSLGPPLRRARNAHFTPRQAADLHTDCTLSVCLPSLTYVDQLSSRAHQTVFQYY